MRIVIWIVAAVVAFVQRLRWQCYLFEPMAGDQSDLVTRGAQAVAQWPVPAWLSVWLDPAMLESLRCDGLVDGHGDCGMALVAACAELDRPCAVAALGRWRMVTLLLWQGWRIGLGVVGGARRQPNRFCMATPYGCTTGAGLCASCKTT